MCPVAAARQRHWVQTNSLGVTVSLAEFKRLLKTHHHLTYLPIVGREQKTAICHLGIKDQGQNKPNFIGLIEPTTTHYRVKLRRNLTSI